MPEEEKARKLFSSAGFYTILALSNCTFDYSSGKRYLRKTLYGRIGASSVERIGEEMYKFVNNEAEVNTIKKLSGKWIKYDQESKGNIVVYEHVDSQNFVTGIYKICEMVRNFDGTHTCKSRYYKRVGAK